MSGDCRAVSAERITRLLDGDPFVSRLVLHDEVASTNDAVRALADEGAGEGTVVIARKQRAGRGRLGRPWHSPADLGLYLSVLIRPGGPVTETTRWTVAVAIAACAACRRLGGGSPQIKWPNDVVAQGRKLGGVLIEMRTAGSRVTELIVGAGFNVGHRLSDFPEELRPRATSIRMLDSGRTPDTNLLAAEYLKGLGRQADALRRGDWPDVALEWEQLARGARGMRVRVMHNDTAYVGRTAGLDCTGALRVQRDDGVVELVHMAESLHPLEVDHAAGG